MSNALYIIAGVYLVAMGYFLKTTPGESGPFVSGDERVKQVATPARRIIVVAFGLLMLVYGVYEVVQARARAHRDHADADIHATTVKAERFWTQSCRTC